MIERWTTLIECYSISRKTYPLSCRPSSNKRTHRIIPSRPNGQLCIRHRHLRSSSKNGGCQPRPSHRLRTDSVPVGRIGRCHRGVRPSGSRTAMCQDPPQPHSCLIALTKLQLPDGKQSPRKRKNTLSANKLWIEQNLSPRF